MQRRADLVASDRCGCLLDHLLVAPLERAVALAEDRLRVPTTCTSTWRPRSTYGSTKTVPSPNADSASACAAAISPGRSASARTIRMPRPPPPADAFTSRGRSASVAVSTGGCEHRDAGRVHQLLRLDLRAHLLDRLGRRPDPGEPGVDHGAGEVGVLGEEAVAGVDRVGAGRLGRRQHRGRRRGRSRPGCCRAAVRRRRPRGRTAGRRPRRSGSRRSRCRASRQVRKTRDAISARLATSEIERDLVGPSIMAGTPRTGRCRRTACSRSPRGRCRGSVRVSRGSMTPSS